MSVRLKIQCYFVTQLLSTQRSSLRCFKIQNSRFWWEITFIQYQLLPCLGGIFLSEFYSSGFARYETPSGTNTSHALVFSPHPIFVVWWCECRSSTKNVFCLSELCPPIATRVAWKRVFCEGLWKGVLKSCNEPFLVADIAGSSLSQKGLVVIWQIHAISPHILPPVRLFKVSCPHYSACNCSWSTSCEWREKWLSTWKVVINEGLMAASFGQSFVTIHRVSKKTVP